MGDYHHVHTLLPGTTLGPTQKSQGSGPYPRLGRGGGEQDEPGGGESCAVPHCKVALVERRKRWVWS